MPQESASELRYMVADDTARLQRRWKPIEDVADRAGKYWVAAEARIGEEHASCFDRLPHAHFDLLSRTLATTPRGLERQSISPRIAR